MIDLSKEALPPDIVERETSVELEILDKVHERETERYSYHMFYVIGIIFFAVGFARMMLGDQSLFPIDYINLMLIAMGFMLFFGAYGLSAKPAISAEQAMYLQQKERDQYQYESGSYGFSHSHLQPYMRNRDKELAEEEAEFK